jgi:hypothetical protein
VDKRDFYLTTVRRGDLVLSKLPSMSFSGRGAKGVHTGGANFYQVEVAIVIRGFRDCEGFKWRFAEVCGAGFDVNGEDLAGMGREVLVLETLFVELPSEFSETGWVQDLHQ